MPTFEQAMRVIESEHASEEVKAAAQTWLSNYFLIINTGTWPQNPVVPSSPWIYPLGTGTPEYPNYPIVTYSDSAPSLS